jgi:hypothetical protein
VPERRNPIPSFVSRFCSRLGLSFKLLWASRILEENSLVGTASKSSIKVSGKWWSSRTCSLRRQQFLVSLMQVHMHEVWVLKVGLCQLPLLTRRDATPNLKRWLNYGHMRCGCAAHIAWIKNGMKCVYQLLPPSSSWLLRSQKTTQITTWTSLSASPLRQTNVGSVWDAAWGHPRRLWCVRPESSEELRNTSALARLSQLYTTVKVTAEI